MGKTAVKWLLLMITLGLLSCGNQFDSERSEEFLDILDTGEIQEAYGFYMSNQSVINIDTVDNQDQSILHYIVDLSARAEQELNRSQSMSDAFVQADKLRLNQITAKSIKRKIKYYDSRIEGVRSIIEDLLATDKYQEPPVFLQSFTPYLKPEGSTTPMVYRGLCYQQQLLLTFYFFHPQRIHLLNDHIRAYDEYSLSELLLIRMLLRHPDTELKNEQGQTVMDLAKELKAKKVLQILESDEQELTNLLAKHHAEIKTIEYKVLEEGDYSYSGRQYVVALDYGVPQVRKLREDISQHLIKLGLFDQTWFQTTAGIPAGQLKITFGENFNIKVFQQVLVQVSKLDLPVQIEVLTGPKNDGIITIKSMVKGQEKTINSEVLEKLLKPGLSLKRMLNLIQ